MLMEALLGGTAGVLPGSGQSLKLLKWMQAPATTENTLGNGVAGIAFTPAIAVFDAEQIGLQLVIRKPGPPAVAIGTAVIMRLQWSPDAVSFGLETVNEQGALVGANPTASRRFDCPIREWGPLAPSAADGLSVWFHRPPDAHFFQVGIYSNGVPGANDEVILNVERQRGSSLQGS